MALFTPEELAELAAADAELEETFIQTPEEIAASRDRDRAAALENTDPKKRIAAERYRAYYQKNRDKIIARQTAYNQAHREQMSEYHKRYYQKHRDELLTKQTAYHCDHREQISVYRKAHYQKNRDLMLAKKKERYRQKKAAEGVSL